LKHNSERPVVAGSRRSATTATDPEPPVDVPGKLTVTFEGS